MSSAPFDLARALGRVAELAASRSTAPLGRIAAPEDVATAIDVAIGHAGVSFEQLLGSLEAVVGCSVNTASPLFHNQLFSGFNPPAFLGDVVASLLNTTMATWEASPAATCIELHLLERLSRLAGLTDGDGTFTSGGSESNLQAMLVARNLAFPAIRADGRWPSTPLVVLMSEHAHYSVRSAAQALGIGNRHVVPVPVDSDGAMRADALAAAVGSCRAEGREPFFVCATAGTSLLGAVDPIDQLADVAVRERLWLHVDGCLGASALLAPARRRLLHGIERVDSLAWDAHKLMGVPVSCSVLLMKRRGELEATCAPEGAEYLFHDATAGPDLGRRSLRCARRAGALTLWTAWKLIGEAGYESRTERLFALAESAGAAVDATPGLVRVAPVSTVSVCFRVAAPSGVDGDWLTRAVRERLREQGRAFLNHGPFGGRTILRLVVSNPDVTEDDLWSIVAAVGQARDAVLSGMAQETM